MKRSSTEIELLAPAGNYEKMTTAFHFGADAVYLAGKKFGLRAFADNFTDEEIASACKYAHLLGKKVYVTINIFAKNDDFQQLKGYLSVLENAGVDAVLVSDLGVFSFVKANSVLPIHVSTQANTTNKFAVRAWKNLGATRVVLARELNLSDIIEIHRDCPDVELEAFVHGAMCISYSGRCLLSNYLTERDGNRGECVQACRWKWEVREISRQDSLPVEEDANGTYIFNSKDMNMLRHVDKLRDAGVVSFKIEGRMKSSFYVATVVNAYRRAIDALQNGKFDEATVSTLSDELIKASHRDYTTGFYFDEDAERQYYESSKAVEESKFIAKVLDWQNGRLLVEQRNKFAAGDVLEILSPGEHFNKTFVCANVVSQESGESVEVCNIVQQKLWIDCPYPLGKGDVLRLPLKR